MMMVMMTMVVMVFKWTNYLRGHFSKEDTQGQQVYENRPKLINYKGYVNQNHNEISSYCC